MTGTRVPVRSSKGSDLTQRTVRCQSRGNGISYTRSHYLLGAFYLDSLRYNSSFHPHRRIVYLCHIVLLISGTGGLRQPENSIIKNNNVAKKTRIRNTV